MKILFLLALGMVVNQGWAMEKEENSYETLINKTEKDPSFLVKKIIDDLGLKSDDLLYKFFFTKTARYYDPEDNPGEFFKKPDIKKRLARQKSIHQEIEDTHGHSYQRAGLIYPQGPELEKGGCANGFCLNNNEFNEMTKFLNSKQASIDKGLKQDKIECIDESLELSSYKDPLLKKYNESDEALPQLERIKTINDAIPKEEDENIDALDFTPSVYQYLRYAKKANYENENEKKNKRKYKIQNTIQDQNETLSILLMSWIHKLNEKDFYDDEFVKKIFKWIDICVGYYNKACQNMQEKYKNEEEEIKSNTEEIPLLYSHCARLYECIHNLIFVLFAYHNEEISLENYQKVMYQKDNFYKNKDLEIKDYPATSGCDSFIKSHLAIGNFSFAETMMNNGEYNYNYNSDKYSYYEYMNHLFPYLQQKRKEEKEEKENNIVYWISFVSHGANNFKKGNETILNNLKSIKTRLEKNDHEKIFLIVDTTLDTRLLIDYSQEKNEDTTFKKIHEEFLQLLPFVQNGKLVIIESKSLQKFAQLGCGKIKLGNIRVISKKDDKDIKKTHEKLTIYAKETLKGSRDEINMMLFMTGAQPDSEKIFSNKVYKNVKKYHQILQPGKNANFHPFFVSPGDNVDLLNLFPVTHTFAFASTTSLSPDGADEKEVRISLGVEPSNLIEYYIKNKKQLTEIYQKQWEEAQEKHKIKPQEKK